MKEQDKKLLFKDLSARIPYKTMLWIEDAVSVNNDRLLAVGLNHGDCLYINGLCVDDNCYDRHNVIKPYLRSLSDMAKEEEYELITLLVGKKGAKYFHLSKGGVIESDIPQEVSLKDFNIYWIDFNCKNASRYVDWLNEHHFDFRGLINKGLALKAPKGMYD